MRHIDGNSPWRRRAEQRLLVQYAPCREDQFAWALDHRPGRSSSGTGEPSEQATDAGCGCDTRDVSPTASLLLLGLLARRRHRP